MSFEAPSKAFASSNSRTLSSGRPAAWILADLGAEVIKVEPVDGDRTRKLRGFGAGFFGYFNRNKKSLALDADSTEGRATLVKLLEKADVLIENFAPGLDGQARARSRGSREDQPAPRLLRAERLPARSLREAPGAGRGRAMMGGLAYMTGPSGRPLRAGTSVIDIVGGMFGAFGTVLALKQRDRTGKGGLVESALFESVVFLMGQHLAITAINGAAPPPMPERVSSWAVYEIFNTADDLQVFIASPATASGSASASLQAARTRGRRQARHQQPAHRGAAVAGAQGAAVFKAYAKDDLERMCLEADISFAPVARPQDLFDHPHLLANGSLAATTLPGGVKTRLPLLPFQMFGCGRRWSATRRKWASTTTRCWSEIGYDAAGIAALKAAGVLGPK